VSPADELVQLNALKAALMQFSADTTDPADSVKRWPWGDSYWTADGGLFPEIEPTQYVMNDTALFSLPVGLTKCGTTVTAPCWNGPYLSGGPSMADHSEADLWGNALFFAYIRPFDGFGGGNNIVPNGAIVIWSIGPDGLDETGCTSTAAGVPANCAYDPGKVGQGQSSVAGDDIIVVVAVP
jgi:hypothetical protein